MRCGYAQAGRKVNHYAAHKIQKGEQQYMNRNKYRKDFYNE